MTGMAYRLQTPVVYYVEYSVNSVPNRHSIAIVFLHSTKKSIVTMNFVLS